MAETYTVLARRYRSKTFDELVGQEAIAQTLKNAIRTGRVAHAFLFTGTRGVGKTSAARILAMAINCPNRTPEGNPCTECNSCKAIARGDDIDVIEIDGASNNSVDQIRELRQSAGIRPARSPFKIYVIDEVHMLSGGAFNALLKTLEEPPEHVKFIFATTDIHKVPPTIISRCQRFDFKNISTVKIAAHLKSVVADEGLLADDDALHRVARLGNGSMRDALSILDRVLSMGEKKITDKILEELLGKPPTAAIGDLVQAIARSDAGAAITRADALLAESMGAEQLLSEMIDFFRNIMLVVACGEKTELLDVPAESRGIFITLAKDFDAPTLVHLIALCEQTQRSLKASLMHRPLLDALIVRLALSEQFSSLRDLIGSGDGTSKKKADGGEGPVNPRAPAPEHHQHPQPQAYEQTHPSPGTESLGLRKPDEAIASFPANPAAPENDTSSDEPSAPSASQSPPFDPPAEENIYEVMKQTMAKQKQEQDARNAAMKQQRPNGTYGRPGPTPQTPAAAPPPIRRVTDLSDLLAVWTAARAYLAANARLLESVLGACSRIRSLTQTPTPEVVLLVPTTQEKFTNERAQAKLEEALRAVTGITLKLKVEFVEPPEGEVGIIPEGMPGGANGGGAAGGFAAQRVPPELMEAVKKQPIVIELMKRLDATVTSVEMIREADPTEPAA